MNTIKLGSFTAGVVALAMTTAAEARELRIAPGVPPAHPVNGVLYEGLTSSIPEETGGSLTARILGPEVVTLSQMKDAVQTNVVDVGVVVPLYFPAEMPYFAMLGELAALGRNPQVMAAATAEYMVNCEPCQEEMKNLNMVYLGTGSTDIYHLLLTKSATSLEDMKGLRLRSGGAPFSRWAEYVGAAPARVALNETFEALSQGTIDGTMAAYGDLVAFRLGDLITNLTSIPLGTFHANAAVTVNTNTWGSLSDEEKLGLAHAAVDGGVEVTHVWSNENTNYALKVAEEANIAVEEPSADLVAATEAFVEQDVVTAAQLANERLGIPDAEARVAEYVALIDKWTGIVDEIGDDPEILSQRVWDEIWSGVDFSTYGK